jgi:hypothetical protein
MRWIFTSADRPTLAIAQGLYFLVTGVWPLVSIGTFEAITGPKTDRWLVKAIGVLVALIGFVLTRAGVRSSVSPDLALLAQGSAAGLACIDIIYVSRGRISPVYALDAVVEAILAMLWTAPERRASAE